MSETRTRSLVSEALAKTVPACLPAGLPACLPSSAVAASFAGLAAPAHACLHVPLTRRSLRPSPPSRAPPGVSRPSSRSSRSRASWATPRRWWPHTDSCCRQGMAPPLTPAPFEPKRNGDGSWRRLGAPVFKMPSARAGARQREEGRRAHPTRPATSVTWCYPVCCSTRAAAW